jgi:hypothetical protein
MGPLHRGQVKGEKRMTQDQFNDLCITYGLAPSRPLRELVDAAIAKTIYDVKLRQNWVGLDLEEMDKIIDGNIKITDPRLRDGVYGVVLDTMTTLMERNGYDEADGTSNLHAEDV